ncbi:hypothetical protein BDA99DRAFT_564560 [Phascolomyces articulosus]|uniref:Enkurin domain-containing protein n=1 Tax=Phascolomyces articulosus TaxID=60185 RepID=A0AAD5K146_9FUNG|nr:hypothetical protein BDA99DRAFT_564560 [Phascolomyces articulosus]
MSSTVKSKDRTSSAGQKFWHLKKLALGNKTNTNDQPLQRPPSPAESAFSIDTASLCDEDTPKPRSKRLSVLLSNRRQGNNGKVAPAKGLPSAMSVQNLHALSSNNKANTNNNNMSTTTVTTNANNVRSVGGGGGVRQRTMSHTVGATAANDTRAAFLRSRAAEGAGGHGLTRHASVRDMKSRAVSGGGGLRSASPPMCSKPNVPEEPVVDPATHPILTKKRSSLPTDSSNKPSSHLTDDRPSTTRRTLRPASSFASLRARRSQQQLQQQQQMDTPRSTDEWCHPNKMNNNNSPPPTPTSPRLGRSNTVQNLSQPGSPRTPTQGSPPRTRGSLPPAFAAAAAASQNNNATKNNQAKVHNSTDEEMSSSAEELSWSRSSDEDGAVVVNNNKDEDGDSTDLSSDSDHNPKRSEAYWRSKLEKERAVVKALQRQKEACNKDISFLSQSVDELTNEKQALLTKYETEKTSRERFQDDLSSVTDKLNEAIEQVRQLASEKVELEKITKEQRYNHEKAMTEQKANLEKEKCSETLSNEKLQAQLRHSQDQVRVLKATMEQFLRMGIFSEDMSIYSDIASKYSTTNKSSAIEALVQQDNTKQQAAVSSSKREEATPVQTTNNNTINYNNTNNNATKQDSTMPEIKCVADLDNHLRELLREKELLQSEYSKIPITGVNALTRRRKEELEARLDQVDSQMSKIKLKHRDLLKK